MCWVLMTIVVNAVNVWTVALGAVTTTACVHAVAFRVRLVRTIITRPNAVGIAGRTRDELPGMW